MFRKMLTLSFDDGTVQDRRFIELIDKYNLRATFNLNSGFFGQKHDIIHEGIKVCHDEVEADEVRQLYRNHEIAVHTARNRRGQKRPHRPFLARRKGDNRHGISLRR